MEKFIFSLIFVLSLCFTQTVSATNVNWIDSGANSYLTGGNVGIGTSAPTSSLVVQGPGSAGTSTFRINPASGTSYTQINDNGTMIINGDYATGTYPLTIKFNGTTQWDFNASGVLSGKAGAVINMGGGLVHYTDSGGIAQIKTFNELQFLPGALSGSGTRTISVIAQNAAQIPFAVKGAASQTANLQEWRNSAGTVLGSIGANGQLNLSAGSASNAPLKLATGTLLTTTEAGAIEFNSGHLYFTASSGGTRYQLDQQGGSYTLPTASASVLGGVMVGSGLTITAGVLSVTGGGSSTSFIGLTDVPSTFTGHAGECVVVNSTETALEFVPCGGSTTNVFNAISPTLEWVIEFGLLLLITFTVFLIVLYIGNKIL